MISVFALSRLLFAPVSGRIVGRFGELPAYLIGLSVVAVSTGGCAFATAYWQLIALRLLGGIGSTMFTVSALSLLIRLAPASMRGRASSLWATGFLLGNIVGPLVGGGLVVISLRAPFLVYAVVLVLVVGLTGPLLRDRPGGGAAAAGAGPGRPVPGRAGPSAPTAPRWWPASPTAGRCSACGWRWSRCWSSRCCGSRSRGAGWRWPCSPPATRSP